MRFRIAMETKPWVCLGEITWVVLTEVEDNTPSIPGLAAPGYIQEKAS